MSLLNTPLTKEDFINSHWQDVVNSTERKECLTYNKVFWNKAQAAKEAGNVKEQSVFEILEVVTGAAIQPRSNEEFLAKFVECLTDEHLDFLAEIVDEVSNPELQARIADILWTSKRRDYYKMAQLAVTDYLKSAAELEDPENETLCFARIERALWLARKINHNFEDVVAHIEKVLERCNGEDPKFLSAELMELLQEHKRGNFNKYAALAEKAATLSESANDWRRARNYWEIKAQWHRLEKDAEQERAAQMQAAETYVKEAEDSLKGTDPSYLQASPLLQKAFEAFMNVRGTKEETIAAKEKAEEVRKLLSQYQEQSLNELVFMSHETDISVQVNIARSHVKGKEFDNALFYLAFLGTPHKVSHLRQEVLKIAVENPISHLFPSSMINQMGKVVAHQPKLGLSNNPEQVEESIRFEMYRNAVFYQRLHAQAYIKPARDQINLEHSVQLKDFFPLVLHNPFVQPGREYLFAKGLYAGLTGDFFTSTHILIPQIENSVRYLLRKHGALPSKIDIDKGIENERDLNTTLFSRNYPQINSIFDEDTLFDLQGLLIERSGSNLRNRMAHGLINDGEFNSPIMSYLWWVTLRLCCLPILKQPQQVEESNPWVNFDGLFKDDPLFDDFVEDMAANRRELDAEVAAYEASLEENQSA
ncbi:DUF4209 domain-containing protein [Nostoc sp. WHI]|uniref:DUF4209 domain-containing protein n=1 Tax=Nostoc sp. WHI TaxID=2650611 RepID=UPI0018C7B1DD|nr:DUF4209 domain-containing protein [Nostoc sp. WHI]MBG1265387.1 DUF4209 domain-containing protein [Nostoc sp. WHI]